MAAGALIAARRCARGRNRLGCTRPVREPPSGRLPPRGTCNHPRAAGEPRSRVRRRVPQAPTTGQTRPLRSRSLRVEYPLPTDLCRNNPARRRPQLAWVGYPGTRVQRENGLGDANNVAREASRATTIVTKRCRERCLKRCRERCRKKSSPTSQLPQAKISRVPPIVGTNAPPIGTTAVPILGA